MGLDMRSLESLAREISKEYLKKMEYSSSKNVMDYEVEINNELERYLSDEEKYKALVSFKDDIKKELSLGCLPTDLIEWQNEVTALLKNKLEKLNLSLMEYPQNSNSTWFLNVINKEEKFIDDAKLFLNKFEKSDPKGWAIIIKEIENKSNSNIKFWAEFKTQFNFDSLDRSDQSNMLIIYDLGNNFYLNLSTKLNLILDSFKNQEPLLKKNGIDAFSIVFNSFIRKENDLIDNLNRIKKRYDDTIEDVNYKTLLKKVMDLYPELKIDKNFELIKKLEKIESKISTFVEDNFRNRLVVGGFKKNPEELGTTFKLVLKTKGLDIEKIDWNIRNSFDKLKKAGFIDGEFKDYKTIFSADTLLSRKITWLGDRNELKYLICKLSGQEFRDTPINKEVRIILKETGNTIFWDNNQIFQKAANSFLNKEKGKEIIPLEGVSKPRARTYLQSDRKEILDTVAALFIKE